MEKILKNGVSIFAILVGVCGTLYQKTGMKFFDYATVISCAILVGLTIYNITVLVDNKKVINDKRLHLFGNLFFLLLGYTYLFLKLVVM